MHQGSDHRLTYEPVEALQSAGSYVTLCVEVDLRQVLYCESVLRAGGADWYDVDVPSLVREHELFLHYDEFP